MFNSPGQPGSQPALTAQGPGFNLSSTVETIRANEPRYWEMACPRVYKAVENFNDYRMPAIMHAVILSQMQRGYGSDSPPPQHLISNLVVTAEGAKYNFPAFFVGRDLLTAALETSPPPGEIDWENFRLPFPYMDFILPRNSLYVDGKSVAYLQVTRVNQGRQELPFGGGVSMDRTVLLVRATLSDNTAYGHEYYRPFHLDQTSEEAIRDSQKHGVPPNVASAMRQIAAALFNILFVMQARPELVEGGRKLGSIKKSKSELWTPNVIGRKYSFQRADPETEIETHPGSGIPRRIHWRRGHFRRQPCGKGLSEIRVIWLEPVIIGLAQSDA